MTQTHPVSMSYINIDMPVPQAPSTPPLNICIGRPASLEPTGGALPVRLHTAEGGFTSTPARTRKLRDQVPVQGHRAGKGSATPEGEPTSPPPYAASPAPPGEGGRVEGTVRGCRVAAAGRWGASPPAGAGEAGPQPPPHHPPASEAPRERRPGGQPAAQQVRAEAGHSQAFNLGTHRAAGWVGPPGRE